MRYSFCVCWRNAKSAHHGATTSLASQSRRPSAERSIDAPPCPFRRVLPMSTRALLPTLLSAASALQAKWTPASDGGPARFSKKYRDAQGIDDSKWTNDGDDSGFSLFPTTPEGWLLAAVAFVIIWIMLGVKQPANWQTGERVGGARGEQRGQSAAEAARAAALKRFGDGPTSEPMPNAWAKSK